MVVTFVVHLVGHVCLGADAAVIQIVMGYAGATQADSGDQALQWLVCRMVDAHRQHQPIMAT